jgi:outer membrane protein
MNAIRSLAMVLILLVLSSSAYAQEIKIGYMNPQAVLDALPQTDQLRQQMEAYLQQKQQELVSKEQSVNAEYQNFLANAVNLSEDELETEQERLA